MAKRQAKKKDAEGLLTLSEVSRRTGISMPTLQRYKKLYQDRIPSVGEGRKQRYHPEALPVFVQLKKENIAKRGRPKKSASAKKSKRSLPPKRGRRPAASKSSDQELLTLTRIGELTKISYPTLVRYVKLHGRDIPHVGSGRKRRFLPEAVEVFKQLRASSKRGGRKRRGSATAGRRAAGGASGAVKQRIAALEKSYRDLERKYDRLVAKLKKPIL